MEPRPKSGGGGVWQLWGWSLQFGLGCWLIGNQSAGDAALIKGAVESGVGNVSRGAVVRSAEK